MPIRFVDQFSVCFPVIIFETRFQQKFVVSDGITTEDILGMDFMEVNKCVVNMQSIKMNLT